MGKVTAIIQARMGATRLPGKVLMPVLGRPIMSYMFEPLQAAGCIRDVVLATTDATLDDPVAALGEEYGVAVYRGSESDVLDRYYQAAKMVDAEHVMRVTGDCPLLQPQILDQIASVYFDEGLSYSRTGESFAEGLDCEIFSFAALEASWKEARMASEREHVTWFMDQRPERFATRIVENDRDDARYRLTLDEPEDFEVLKAVLEALWKEGMEYLPIADVRAWLDAHPEVYNLNATIIRNEGMVKSLAEDREVD